MIIIFIGPQGSGKGTQAKYISEKLKLAHISTGDLLRKATGKLKEKVDSYMNTGRLIPDGLMIKIIKERLNKPDCHKGAILDGFPRNIEQAEELDKIIDIDKVIEINISDEEAIRRLGGRLTCRDCGAVYNERTNQPRQKDICDKDGGRLTKRSDDTETAIKARLEIYHKETFPILSHYKDILIKINGENPIEKVTEDILEKLN